MAATTLSVKDFGAKGDGKTDDYEALQAAAKSVCKTPGAVLVFPQGVYKISRHRILAGAKKNTVKNITFENCRNVIIQGNGAKIDIKGDFYRKADQIQGKYGISYEEGVIPFEMRNSSGWTITGFELDGNVDQMQRSANVIEGYNAGITTTNCRDYFINDVYVHHFHTDGIILGSGATIADLNGTLDRIDSANNGRQGISVLQARHILIKNSVFRDTGRTGAYGSHAPAAGADVEPVRMPPAVDVKTSNIIFDSCRFENNLGYQFTSNWPDKVDHVTVENSIITAMSNDVQAGAFINIASNAVIRNNTFNIASGKGVILGPISPNKQQYISSIKFEGNTFNLKSRTGIHSPSVKSPIQFVKNNINVQHSGPEANYMWFEHIQSVAQNNFFLSANGYAGSSGLSPYAIVYSSIPNIVANSYKTDLVNGRYLVVYYGSSKKDTTEQFTNSSKLGSVAMTTY